MIANQIDEIDTFGDIKNRSAELTAKPLQLATTTLALVLVMVD
jgi:hypothetical protein